MSQYTRKPEVVHVEVITEPLYEQLREADPGVVKHASVGDYFAVGADGSKRIITPGQLCRGYEPVVEGAGDVASDLDALKESLEKSYEHIERLEKRATDQGVAIDNIEKRTAPLVDRIAALESNCAMQDRLVALEQAFSKHANEVVALFKAAPAQQKGGAK